MLTMSIKTEVTCAAVLRRNPVSCVRSFSSWSRLALKNHFLKQEHDQKIPHHASPAIAHLPQPHWQQQCTHYLASHHAGCPTRRCSVSFTLLWGNCDGSLCRQMPLLYKYLLLQSDDDRADNLRETLATQVSEIAGFQAISEDLDKNNGFLIDYICS